ncbi:glycosyltransferase [Mucilaginibacter sp. JRF]|uniref:glycosyltransferase n=1 Tax=Mucilaginibacter sp. JRF TaxID=2780088 RepID=UPI001880E7CB|nr:glycosyltransferase [Mucilaginibacter sp. JRF]MBE9585874.1 glycosyltransferase [Mucilaginibacter sp. JRF]
MKVAIVHDNLVCKGGAEQVTLSFHQAFPDAPVYTLSYDRKNTYPEFQECDVRTSWFGRVFKSEKNCKRFYFPLGIMAMQQLDLRSFDIVLQSTTHCAKYIKTNPDALIITYCHNPFRLVWSSESYEKVTNAGAIKKALYNRVLSYLREYDRGSAQKTSWFITNSREVLPRIEAAYSPKNEVSIINPSVKCKNFYVSNKPGEYYLIVSRFESYKKVDMVIEAFNQMPDKHLVVVGKGSREAEIKKMANENTTFLSGLSADDLAKVYANCKAFIFPQLEDYGITPLEANASGRPVIAYGRGGVTETMVPYTNDAQKATAVFFEEQTTESLTKAVNLFETLEFNSSFIRAHAESFDEGAFVQKIKSFVLNKYKNAESSKADVINGVPSKTVIA